MNFTKPKRQFFVKRKEMKKFICTTILTVLMASAAVAGRQDNPEEYLGLPGDNLNLYAVMKLFQESETLEGFEKSLNDQESRINNLDLNTDGYVDYITVSDYVNGDVHTIVLRSVLDRNEYQDVAVFTVEQLRNGEVQIQLIGDEALYGRNYIVEPIYAETPNPGYRGRTVQRNNVTVVTTTYYEVAAWPVIRFMYSPRYTIWRSNWYWGYYPVYWHPWTPFYWHEYYGYHYHWYPTYYSCYRHWHQPRWHHYHDYYYGSVRAYSPNVSHRITEGNYRQTYSRPDTRSNGEALYRSTQGRRSAASQSAGNSRPAAVGSDRRSSAATGGRSVSGQQDASRTRSTGTAAGSDRRNPAAGQTGDARRSTGTTVKSSQPPVSNRQSETATQTRSRTRSTSTTVQRAPSNESVSQRSNTTVSQRTSAPSARTQTSSSGRSSAPAARTQSSSSGRSSAPAARTQSNSSRGSATVSSRSSRSSEAPSRSSSSSSSSSGKSDNNSRSSRR